MPPSPSEEEEPAGEIEGRSSQSSKGSSLLSKSSSSSSSSSNEAAAPEQTAAAEAIAGDGDFATRQVLLSAAHGTALLAGHGDGTIATLCDVEATACVAARSEVAMMASKEKTFFSPLIQIPLRTSEKKNEPCSLLPCSSSSSALPASCGFFFLCPRPAIRCLRCCLLRSRSSVQDTAALLLQTADASPWATTNEGEAASSIVIVVGDVFANVVVNVDCHRCRCLDWRGRSRRRRGLSSGLCGCSSGRHSPAPAPALQSDCRPPPGGAPPRKEEGGG